MKRLLVCITIILAAFSFNINAERYTWSRYDLTFDVPNGGFVTYNTNSAFEIQWADFTVSIKLFTKDGADDNFLKYNLRKLAASYNMYDTQLKKKKLEGFKGFDIVGTLPDGSQACLSNFVSKSSNLAMQVEINYISGNEKTVEDVLKSITEGKKQKVKNEDKSKKYKQKIQKKDAKPKPIKPGTTESGKKEELFDI